MPATKEMVRLAVMTLKKLAVSSIPLGKVAGVQFPLTFQFPLAFRFQVAETPNKVIEEQAHKKQLKKNKIFVFM